MTTHDAFGERLAAWFEGEATADGAAVILEAALERTAARRPRAAWLVGLRRSTGGGMPLGRSATRRFVSVAIAALAIAALLAGALLLAGQRRTLPAPQIQCVGSAPMLCGYGAGDWTSTVFASGLSARFPVDGWYVRDAPDHVEFKIAPMTSVATIHLDPIPAAEPWLTDPDTPASIPILLDWLTHDGQFVVGPTWIDETNGFPTTTFDLRFKPTGHACRGIFGTRANPTGRDVIPDCHYLQRMSLMDVGNGHVVAVVRSAYDSRPETLDRFDAAFAPVLESLRLPATITR